MMLLILIGIMVSLPIRLLAYIAGAAYASISQGFRHGQILYHQGTTESELSQIAKMDSARQLKSLTDDPDHTTLTESVLTTGSRREW